MAGEVVVRGPGNGSTGYCALASSAATATSKMLTLRASTRAASVVPVEVVYNPSSLSVTTPSGLVVPGGDYDVHFTPVGGPAKDVVGALPTVPSGLYPASWVNASGYPKQLAFGWVASTGSVTDYHEIDDVVVTTLNPVPQLAVAQTSYAAATLTAGSPVTYYGRGQFLGGGGEPAGDGDRDAAGRGSAGRRFGYGMGVRGAERAADIVHGQHQPVHQRYDHGQRRRHLQQRHPGAWSSPAPRAVASSADASPATSSSAPAGTVPAAPTVTSVSPTNGAAGGGNDVTVTGTGLAGATAIEIGTAAQFTAGTPTTLNLCATSAARLLHRPQQHQPGHLQPCPPTPRRR